MGQTEINLPSRKECEELWDKYHTPLHIREHMKQVNMVAVYLATALKNAGQNVNIDLVDRASLLHDTVRVTEWDKLSFEYFTRKPSEVEISAWEEQRKKYSSDIPHPRVNFEIFSDQYPELAQVILVHSIIDAPNVKTWEEKIVNYADRRVAHDKIVTVKERLDEGFARYSKTSRTPLERDKKIIKATYQIEKEIFSLISGDPDNLDL